jgi:MoxR-like ATPase
MSQCVLFDELNRATPKTQSALLEAMQERQVTVDGVTHALPQPFIVLATQNPIDYEGTFTLTEAQRDRFFMHIAMGYPSTAGARTLLDTYLAPQQQMRTIQRAPQLEPVMTPEQVLSIFAARAGVFLDPKVRDYIIALVEATHQHAEVRLGLSPRASLMIGQAAQANAAFAGREFVTPDDVQAILRPVAAHRLILYSKADLAGRTATQVLDEVVAQTPAPSWPATAARTTGKPRLMPGMPRR